LFEVVYVLFTIKHKELEKNISSYTLLAINFGIMHGEKLAVSSAVYGLKQYPSLHISRIFHSGGAGGEKWLPRRAPLEW
jgi:hypothetical protein